MSARKLGPSLAPSKPPGAVSPVTRRAAMQGLVCPRAHGASSSTRLPRAARPSRRNTCVVTPVSSRKTRGAGSHVGAHGCHSVRAVALSGRVCSLGRIVFCNLRPQRFHGAAEGGQTDRNPERLLPLDEGAIGRLRDARRERLYLRPTISAQPRAARERIFDLAFGRRARLVGCSALLGSPPELRTARVVLRIPRSASLTDASEGKASVTSGSSSTMLVPSRNRLKYLPRTPPFMDAKSYSGRMSSSGD